MKLIFKNWFNSLVFFYYTFFEEFIVDCLSLFLLYLFVYYGVIYGPWTLVSLMTKLYFIFLYELLIWPLPFIYTVDLGYRYVFEQFFNWLDAQDEVLRSWRW
jgi:hypothetical protein